MPQAQNIQGELHVDRYLTNYSVGYMQEQAAFVASAASSFIPVQKQSDKFVIYDRGYFWRDEVKTRPLGGRPPQTGYEVDAGNYNAEEYGLEHYIDDRQRANADAPISLDTNAARLLSGKHMIRFDRHWAQNFFATGKWTTEWTGVASSPTASQFLQFNDANSDPIDTIDQIKDTIHEATGFMPNTMILGSDVKRVLRSHPDIADRIKYTRTGIADEEVLQALFEIERVVTARSIYNSAAEGATDSFNYIVNKKAIWLGYIERNPGLDSPTAIATFAWTGLIPGMTNVMGGVIERGRDNPAHSDYFQQRMAWDMKQVADDLGAWLGSAVA